MPGELQIIRTETIVVESATPNQYGDLIVTDKAGTTHKIGQKREYLFSQFEQGRAVEIGYAIYMNKEYIATAKLVEITPTRKTMPAAKQTLPPTTRTTLAKEAIEMGAKLIPTGDDRTRSMAVAYAKDLAVAGKIELKDITRYADKFLAFILGKE